MKTKKVLILLASALFLLASCNNNEEFINDTSPTQKEENFLSKTAIAFANSINQTNTTRSATTYSVKSINTLPVRQDLPATRTATELPDFYTVTLDNNQGTVLLSAKNRQAKPLAYFMKENNINVNEILKDTISDLAFLIQTTIEQNMEMPVQTRAVMPDDFIPDYEYLTLCMVKPKCKVWWHQNYPYNQFCPLVEGKPAATGCVAIAGAQAATVLRPNLPGVSSWDKIATYEDHIAIKEKAKLIAYIASKVNKNYGVHNSAGDNDTLAAFFEEYGIKDYDAEHAIDVLNTEHGVIVAKGYRSVHGWFKKHYVDGHTFLADGYIKLYGQDDYYLHLNYGWGNGWKNDDTYILTAKKHWDRKKADKIKLTVYANKLCYYSFAYETEKNW